MSLTNPYRQNHYLGEYASDAAALAFIQANDWDSNGDGTGNPRNGMLYYNTTSHVFRGYQNGSWVTLRTTPGPIVLSLSGNMASYLSTNSTTYVLLDDFVFPGSDVVGVPAAIRAVLDVSTATSIEFRIYDVTNAQVIAAVSTANTYPTITDLGTISNIPTTPAVFELQAKRTGGTPSTYVEVHSMIVLF